MTGENGNTPRKRRNFDDGEITFTEKTAAKRLGISYITLLRHRRKGLVPFYRCGSRVLYDDSCLEEFLAKSRRSAA